MSHHTIEFTLPDDAYEMNCAIHQVYRSTLQRIAEELHRRVKYRDEGDDDLEDFQRWLHEELKDVGIGRVKPISAYRERSTFDRYSRCSWASR